jgi:putative peptidoglycan lipid II flippase
MAAIRLVRGFLTVGSWTLVSRGVGFVRDVMMAAYLGTGPVAEAFLIAFSLPNMFRRFFAEGAFNMAFVPMFAKKLERGEDAEGFAREAFSGLGALLVAFTLAGTLLMPWLVLAMASGFRGDERFDLAVTFGRISFSYILFISLVALLSGVLTTRGRFTEASFVPVLMNLMFIAAMLAADRLGWDMGLTLAWTVPLTGIAQLAFTWAWARRAGFRFPLVRPRLTPDLRRLAVIAAPAVLAGGVVQINLLVGRQVASFTEGAVAWLSYADRLYQLPLGVVGVAVGVVLLPDLSRRLGAGDTAGGRHAFNRAGEFSLLLTVPAAVALMVIPVPIIQVLFERGAFGPDDTAATAMALAVYGAGLPAFVLQKVLQPVFYAREDTRSPFRYAVWAMLINAAAAVGLSYLLGFIAAALGTTLAGWAMVWMLWAGSRGMGEAVMLDDRARRRVPRIVIASLVMGAVLWAANLALAPLFVPGGTDVLALALLVIAGVGAYFGTGLLIGAFTIADFRRALARGRG